MDDFENDELYDYDDYDDYNEPDYDESLKDKYDRAKEYKEKFDEIKEKYDKYKNNKSNKSSNKPSTEMGKKAGKDVTKESGKQATKQGGQELAKQGGKKAGEEIAKEAGKKATTEAGKKAAKEGAKVAAKEGAKVAAEGAAASTGVGIIVAVGIEVADRLNKIKKKVDKKVDSKIEDATGIKDFSKKKKFIPILLIIAIFMMLFLIPALAMYSVSETATSELTTLVRTREKSNKKELILFTKSEIKQLLKKDIDVEATIATELSDEGYTLEPNDDGTYKSISYKTILKNYGNDLTTTFMSNDLTNVTDGMEDILEEGESYDSLSNSEKDLSISVNNVKKFLMAEIDNFNNGVKWQTTELKTNYLNLKSDEFEDYYDFVNQTDKLVSDGTHDLIDKSISNKNYTIEDDNGKNTMLKMPKLSQYGVNVALSGGENEAAREFVDMLAPYMQKWIIPYTIYIDTQDDDFVDSIMEYMYHPAEVSIFQLQKLVKTVKYEYYMMCYQYEQVRYCESDDEGNVYCWWETIPGTTVTGLNTKDHPVGYEYIGAGHRIVTKVSKPYVIARDSNGNPLTKKISVTRKLDDADSSAELTYLGSFYEETRKEYNILPINENNLADTSTTGELKVNDNTGIGKQTITDEWNETLVMESYETEKYKVSYYDEEDYEKLGRDISRIEWYQDVMGTALGGLNLAGEFGTGTNKFEKAYNGAYKETLERIWDGIVSWGYTEEQAAAIIGNIAQESSFNVTAVNSIGATGLCQWLGGRRNMLYSFASSKGTSWNDLTTQIQFLCMEVAWNERYPYTSYQWSGYGQALNAFKTGTVEEAAVGFRKGFERCGEEEANDAVRIACARSAYETFAGRTVEYPIEKIAASSTTDTSISTNAGLGGGDIEYSYDDMYFAYYQIEQWYQKIGLTFNSNSITSIALPGGGFSWPVDVSGNVGAKKINKLYGVDSIDGIQISTGNVWSYDDTENLYKGADVLSTHSGKVVAVQPVEGSNKYAYIEIETDDGEYKTHYGNLSEIIVAVGDTVTKGQKIGKIGNTGSGATGADIYLTYKMSYNGSKVDPLQYYYVKDSAGNRVDNYDEIDKNSVASGAYSYDSSKQYLGGESSAIEGDVNSGIHYYFTSSSGRTYACYLQNRGPWKNLRYASRTIYEWGCAVTSVATIMSGYGFPDITPATYAGDMPSIIGIVQAKLPKSRRYTPSGATNTKNKIIEHLQKGDGVIIHSVTGNKYAPGGTHWMALLGVREGTSGIEVFVADPWYGNQPEGWRSLDVMLVSLSSYILIES